MILTYKVTFEDGTVAEVDGKARDFIKFERHFKVPVSDAFRKTYLEHIWFLAFAAATRGQADADFDAWCDTVAEVETNDVEVEDVPLGSDPSLGL